MPTMARTLLSMRYSSQLFGAALLVCVLMTLMTTDDTDDTEDH